MPYHDMSRTYDPNALIDSSSLGADYVDLVSIAVVFVQVARRWVL